MDPYLARIIELCRTLKHFVVASEELAESNIARQCKSIPKKSRKSAIRRRLSAWKRRVEDLIAEAQDRQTSEILASIKTIPHDAFLLTHSPEEASTLISDFSEVLATRPSSRRRDIVGIAEHLLNKEIVILWLWRD